MPRINQDSLPSANFGDVIAVLKDMQTASVIKSFAIGGAVAAILHYEPISTVDLDIFFFLAEKSESSILSLAAIYDYAKANGFEFDHEFINIHGWLVQFVEASHSGLWTEAVIEAETMLIDDAAFAVIGREHLTAMWLLAGRAKDYQKIALFYEAGLLEMKKLFDILQRHNLLKKWQKEQWRFINE